MPQRAPERPIRLALREIAYSATENLLTFTRHSSMFDIPSRAGKCLE
jgi:hypothetical protein